MIRPIPISTAHIMKTKDDFEEEWEYYDYVRGEIESFDSIEFIYYMKYETLSMTAPDPTRKHERYPKMSIGEVLDTLIKRSKEIVGLPSYLKDYNANVPLQYQHLVSQLYIKSLEAKLNHVLNLVTYAPHGNKYEEAKAHFEVSANQMSS